METYPRIITVDLFSAALDYPGSNIHLVVPNPMAYANAIEALSERHFRVTLIGADRDSEFPKTAVVYCGELPNDTNGGTEESPVPYQESLR